jgi:DNA-binding HxlR family transcriptional regulator
MVAASRRALELIAPKWRLEVLFLLSRGTRRHGELYRELGTVSKKVLTQTLRGLEADGLVARTVYPEVPTRVEYLLTQLGWSLTTPLLALADWGEQHQGDIDRSGPLHTECGAAA